MKTSITINATPREPGKKGKNRQLRRQGLVPGIFYGPRREPQPITLKASEIKKIISFIQEGGLLVKLLIQDNGSSFESVTMIKDHQIDPVRRDILHVDFYEVDLEKPLQVEVAINLVGAPIGVEQGGLLQQVQRTLMISALPSEIPDQIEVDVSHLENGHSLHVRDIQLPAGIELFTDLDTTIAVVASPKGLAEEVEIEEEMAEEGEEVSEEKADTVPEGESAADDSESGS